MNELVNMTKEFFGGGMDKIWDYIKKSAVKGGREVTRILLELFYVLKDPATPGDDKTLIIAALAYQLLPTDLLPGKKFGLWGALDNAVAIGYAYNKVKKIITPEIRSQVNGVLDHWFGPEEINEIVD